MKKTDIFEQGWRTAVILLLLTTLIFTPRPLAGQWALRKAVQAEATGTSTKAADYFSFAAARLPWNSGLWEKAGNAYVRAAEWPEAIAAYTNGAAQGHLTSQGYTGWGETALAQDHPAQARAFWQKALQLGGEPAILLPRLAKAAKSMGDFTSEQQSWLEYVALRPLDSQAQYRLGLILTALAPAEALPHLLAAVRTDPGLDASVQALRTSINAALLSDDPAYQALICGRALAALPSWDLAELSFRRAISLRPGYAEAWAWLAEAEQQRGQAAQTDIEQAVRLNPNSALVQSLYGLYLQRQQQPFKALAAFQIAAALEPQDAGWQLALGRAYELAHDLIKALASYQKATQLAPQNASTWQALADFCLRDTVDLQDIGLPAVRRLVELDPAHWQSLDLAGQILLELQNFPGAEALLQKSLTMAPEQAEPALHLALLYLQNGRLPAAHSLLLQASKLDPSGSAGWQANRLLDQYFP